LFAVYLGEMRWAAGCANGCALKKRGERRREPSLVARTPHARQEESETRRVATECRAALRSIVSVIAAASPPDDGVLKGAAALRMSWFPPVRRLDRLGVLRHRSSAHALRVRGWQDSGCQSGSLDEGVTRAIRRGRSRRRCRTASQGEPRSPPRTPDPCRSRERDR
jgi:hypothetical protein